MVSDSATSLPSLLLRDGDVLWAAGLTELDRIDIATGAVARVAGPEWCICPQTNVPDWSGETPLDVHPSVVVHDSIFTVSSDCGVWQFDASTGARRQIVYFPDWGKPRLWNGKPGPGMSPGMPMSTTAIARDGDGLVACVTTNPWLPHVTGRTELWSLAADGSPRERLTFLDAAAGDLPNCQSVAANDRVVLFSTYERVFRYDRSAQKTTPIFGRSVSVAIDATSAFIVGLRAEIARIPHDGVAPEFLRPEAALTDPPRLMVQVDGDFLYWYEDRALLRLPTKGGAAERMVDGDQNDFVAPITLGFSDDHVYFSRMFRTAPRTILDTFSGQEINLGYGQNVQRTRK